MTDGATRLLVLTAKGRQLFRDLDDDEGLPLAPHEEADLVRDLAAALAKRRRAWQRGDRP